MWRALKDGRVELKKGRVMVPVPVVETRCSPPEGGAAGPAAAGSHRERDDIRHRR